MADNPIARAQAHRAQLQTLRAGARYRRVMGFLVAKGFLTAPDIPPKPSAKVPVTDALWAGEVIEPRILEVLPAALLHFPRSFLSGDGLPDDLTATLRCLRSGVASGAPFRGVPYERLARWTTYQLPDQRTCPLSSRRIARTFRLRPDLLARLAQHAAQAQRTQTDILEQAISALEMAPQKTG